MRECNWVLKVGGILERMVTLQIVQGPIDTSITEECKNNAKRDSTVL